MYWYLIKYLWIGVVSSNTPVQFLQVHVQDKKNYIEVKLFFCYL
jgi:hypothetical protein